MPTASVRMGEDGRIVIPASFRKALGYGPGELLSLAADESGIRIQSRRQAIERAQAALAKLTKGRRGMLDDFLRERKAEGNRE